jgi:hypothetical protein
MAVLDHDESAMQPRPQSLFYRLGHRGRSLSSPEHDHALIATQIIPTPADDQLIAVSGDGATDRLPGVDRIQSSNDEFPQKWPDRRGGNLHYACKSSRCYKACSLKVDLRWHG